MPGRKFNGGDYRYGFNGYENDNEVKGDGNSIDFGARMHDPRTGRFFAIDPRAADYPFMSPYCYAANNPNKFTDVNGEGPGDPTKRLIFYRVNNKNTSHNEVFKAAAWRLRNEYNNNPEIYGDYRASATEIKTGGDIAGVKRYEKISSEEGLPKPRLYIFSPKVKTYTSYDSDTFNHPSIGPVYELSE